MFALRNFVLLALGVLSVVPAYAAGPAPFGALQPRPSGFTEPNAPAAPKDIAFAAIGESFASRRYGAIPVERERDALVATLARAIEVLPAPAALRGTP